MILTDQPTALWSRRAITGPEWAVGILDVLFGGGPEDSVYSVTVSSSGITVLDRFLFDNSAKGVRLRKARRFARWASLSRFIPWAEVAAVEPVGTAGIPQTVRIRRSDGTVCELSQYHFDHHRDPQRRAADVRYKCELVREALRASHGAHDRSDGDADRRR